MINLIDEIKILLALRKLFTICPNHPVNMGKSYVIGTIIAQKCDVMEEEFNKTLETLDLTYLEYLELFLSYIARRIPINSLFFSENAQQIIGDVVADMVRTSSFGHMLITSITKKQSRMQKYLSQLCIWGTGRCYNYAALALYYLLEEGIRPVDALWLNSPIIENYYLTGHLIIVIGLLSDDDYKHLSDSEAIVFDFWLGKILPASKFFKEGSQFYRFDTSVIQICRFVDGVKNPFKLPCLIEESYMKEFKQSVASTINSIFHERKNSGEYIPEFRLTPVWIQQSQEDCSNVSDLEFNRRTFEIKQNLFKLKLFDNSARKIQNKFKAIMPKTKTFIEMDNHTNTCVELTESSTIPASHMAGLDSPNYYWQCFL